MAPPAALAGGIAAIAFGVYADLAYNTYSATNSSPQTTELFAGERAETLWKYVKLGDLQVAALSGIGSLLLLLEGHGARALWPLLGGGSVMVAMHLMYAHALRSGTEEE